MTAESRAPEQLPPLQSTTPNNFETWVRTRACGLRVLLLFAISTLPRTP